MGAAAAAAGCAMIFIWGAGCARGGRGSMLTLIATACCTKWRYSKWDILVQ